MELQRPRFFSAGSTFRADRASVLDDALETALRHSSAGRGNIQLLDPDVDGLRIMSQRGFDEPFLTHFEVVRDLDTACGRALLTGAPIRVPDVATSPVFAGSAGLPVMLEAGAFSVQSVPLLDETGKPLGVLSLHYDRPHGANSSDQRLMAMIAKRTSQLLRK